MLENHIDLYNRVCYNISKKVTVQYSTSFSLGIRAFDKSYRKPIYAIYGLVRFADEIVDTFHHLDKASLLEQFKKETQQAIKLGFSTNPILHSFQDTVHQYDIDWAFVDAFFKSMEMDLEKQSFDKQEYDIYIYGSAEAIGLMCLKVFLKDNPNEFTRLQQSAQHLGAAFQKVNFLRDFKSDFEDRQRVYFPDIKFNQFNALEKEAIEADIQRDFDLALAGIQQLPKGAKTGVMLAYKYYLALFTKIKSSSVSQVSEERIRIPDRIKLFLFGKTYLSLQFA